MPKQKFKIVFEENAGEYYGQMIVNGEVKQIDKRIVQINGIVEIDENIIRIEEVQDAETK